MGLLLSGFTVVNAENPHLFVSYNLVDKRTAPLTIREMFIDLQTFAIMGGGQVVVHVS